MKVPAYLALLVLISGAVIGCNAKQPERPAAALAMQTRTVKSEAVETPATLQVTGTLHSRETATLSAQVMGRVQQVLVREGDSVRAGQTLIILDDAALKSASEQAASAVTAAEHQQIAAQTNAALAASTLARYQQLQAQKSVSPQELDEVTRRAEAANAQVEALRAQANAMKAQQSGAQAMLGYTRIGAPFAGVITARLADPGALASPGVPLLQIDSAGPLQLQATVAESAIASVRTGMKLTVSVDASSSGLQGAISQIVPAADPSSHSFLVKIDLPPSKDLRAGMYATAAIPTGATNQAILVPRSAIVVRGSLACAYVLDSNNTAQLRYLTLGPARGDSVEILSGISANERLVDDPGDRNLAGMRIESQS